MSSVVVEIQSPDTISISTQEERTLLTVFQSSAVVIETSLGVQGMKGTPSKLGEIADVDTTDLIPGATLVFDGLREKWVATAILDKQLVDGGNF